MCEDRERSLYVPSHSHVKRLSGVMSDRLPACNNTTLPGKISVKFDIGPSTKTCRETPHLFKIGRGGVGKIGHILAGDVVSPYKRSVRVTQYQAAKIVEEE